MSWLICVLEFNLILEAALDGRRLDMEDDL